MRLHISYCLIALATLSGCGKWQQADSKTSPDGHAIAIVEVKARGASGSNLTKISVENANGGKLVSPGEIVSADGAIVDATRVAWTGANNLHVILCEATAYQIRARLLRDPVNLPDGSENALTVQIENWRYSEQQKGCVRT